MRTGVGLAVQRAAADVWGEGGGGGGAQHGPTGHQGHVQSTGRDTHLTDMGQTLLYLLIFAQYSRFVSIHKSMFVQFQKNLYFSTESNYDKDENVDPHGICHFLKLTKMYKYENILRLEYDSFK